MQQQNDFNYHAKLSESEINNKEEIYQIEEESSLVENTVSQNIDSNHSINTSNVLKNSNEKIIFRKTKNINSQNSYKQIQTSNTILNLSDRNSFVVSSNQLSEAAKMYLGNKSESQKSLDIDKKSIDIESIK